MPPIHNRVFAALQVPVEVRTALQALAREYVTLPDLHWITPANYHITLAFLGDLPNRQLENLSAALSAAKPLPAVTVSLHALARFPDSSGHIVAAMVHKTPALTALHETIVETAIANGIHLRREQFLPHITLARLEKSAIYQDIIPVSLTHLDEFEVCSFALYRGVMDTVGKHKEHYHYRAMASFALKAEESTAPRPGL